MNSNNLQITVFGASGKVGRLVVKELLLHGHSVVAFVHRQSLDRADFMGDSNHFNHSNQSELKVIQGDIYDSDTMSTALTGSHAVISVLGSWGTKRKDVLCSATQAIIPIMKKQQIRRIVSLTGHDARTDGDKISPLHRFSHTLLSVVAGKILRDGEQHISLLRQSQLDWTVLRSPIMTAQIRPITAADTGSLYRLTTKRPAPWATIPRQAVALAMAEQLDDISHIRQSPYILINIK